MLRSRVPSNGLFTVWASAVLGLILLTSGTAAGQATTATLRGNVQDSTGAVLPGATVTVTNVGVRATQTAVTDARGQYQFAALFPGTYELKVEIAGFKTYEQKGITLSPCDNRGIDVKLDIGQQTETVTVTGEREIIQTQTGAREGVLTAGQIDNLSIIGRSSLELLRILPGVVSPDQAAMESVSFGGGANNTQGYTVNGIRSSANTVQLDGSSLIDIGSNSGVIVTESGLVFGAPGEIAVSYEATEDARNVQVHLGFFSALGDGVMIASNELSGHHWESLPATGELVCRWRKVPLLPGAYTVNLYVTVNGEVADWVKGAGRVTVAAGDFFGSGRLPPPGYGAVAVEHAWDVRELRPHH